MLHPIPRLRPLPLVAVVLVACNGSPPVTTDGASESSTGGTTGPGVTSTDPTVEFPDTIAPGTMDPTGDTSGTTGADEEPRSCGADDLPYAGALCGPPERPCTVLFDEAIAGELAPRGFGPALALDAACQPNVAFNDIDGGFNGSFARRALGGRWTTEAFTAPLAGAGLSIDPADPAPLLLVHDGAAEAELFRHDGAWTSLGTLVGAAAPLARQVAHDGAGRLHAVLISGQDRAMHHIFDGAWTSQVLVAAAASAPALAISPTDDQPHAAYFSSMNATWEIFWHVPGDIPELALPYNSSSLQDVHLQLAVVPGAGGDVPYILAMQFAAGEETQRLVLAHRTGPMAWDSTVVESEDPGEPCPEPTEADQTCDVSYTRVRPLALVASAGGDLRALWTRTAVSGTLTSECVTEPIPVCMWNYDALVSTPTLMISWPDGDALQTAEIAGDVKAQGLVAAQVDSAGEIHVALHDGLDPETSVRYLRIGG